MNKAQIISGLGIGLAVGAAAGYMMNTPKKNAMQKTAGRAFHAVGEAMENLSDTMGK